MFMYTPMLHLHTHRRISSLHLYFTLHHAVTVASPHYCCSYKSIVLWRYLLTTDWRMCSAVLSQLAGTNQKGRE